jgi:hypothetical protein
VIRRIFNVSGTLPATGAAGPTDRGRVDGPPSHWVETLGRWRDELHADAFVFWPQDHGTAEIERFAREVVPALR